MKIIHFRSVIVTCNKKLNGERVLNLILALMVALVGEFVWAQLVDSSCRQQCYTDEYHTSECLAKCEQVENIQALQTTSQPSLDTSALEQKKKQCEATVGAKKDLTPSKKELLIQACVAGSENSTQGGTEMNLNNCSGAVSAAKMACESSLFVQQGLSMLNQYQQFKAMGDFNNACNAARNAMTTGILANGGVAAMCLLAQRSCVSACQSVNETPGVAGVAALNEKRQANLQKCEALAEQRNMALLSAGMQSMQAAFAVDCSKLSAGCTGAEAVNDTRCPMQYCSQPGRTNHPVCMQYAAGGSCDKPENANLPQCVCMRNPTAPECGSDFGRNQASPFNPGSFEASAPWKADGSQGFDIDPMAGPESIDKGGRQQAQANPILGKGGAGGGSSGGGMGGFAPPGQGSGAAGDGSGLDTNILGAAKDGYVDPYAGGMRADEGPAAGGRAGAGGKRDGGGDGIDLRAFLPNGRLAGKRGLASANSKLLQSGVTSARGLSNFEKITRTMNSNRPNLLP
ncbi:MAG: hypothetical protein COT74_10375 [Bdellovibrionales bacterium CG10_big_fil_rev_8_21_14_0_10_45_34]|nr:MAG: hypothetical protein COT74_10375 [Bdellovibrionales bacterium CG10_big_fil_rev_8_21_14_0_10_45_34]